ncbi:hypothetical protein HYALB_00006422 [Hymenoscyphus albidus]|uniref:Endonuclease/exonuclease/phosphatase domain-containing protein n=1 Tax=Hymenoscyphus albidus TaxID=595503 RepID=A0A9N9Q4R3_9HELO|nr:hypothetical protein HYALB_00006422 [Hymenoscyphus albidus]
MAQNRIPKVGGESYSIDEQNPINLRIITHNIRYATQTPFEGEEPWPIRRPRLCSQLIFNSTTTPETVICLQEVLHTQLVDIMASLNSSASDGKWAYVGVGRDDGKEAGEYSPIIYRSNIWKVVEWRTVWLSETPTTPSKGWDAASIRIVTSLILIMSTHFDDQGSISRQESAKIILEIIEVEAKARDYSSVLLAGDFNSSPNDGAYQIMTGSQSAMQELGMLLPKEERYGNGLTFTSFGHVDNIPSRIDFIFSRKGNHDVLLTYGVLSNRFDDGIYLSDHRACMADMRVL